LGVRGRLACGLVERDSSDACDLFGDERNVDRLVALPAVGNRSEVRAVGLKDQPLERNRGDGTADGLSSVRTASCV